MSELRIYIISGEGEIGTAEEYTGKVTRRALRSRLTRERCGGDRWAQAVWRDENGEQTMADDGVVEDRLPRS